MNRVLVVFSDGLLSELDSARGLVSRSAWIRQAVEDKLMKEAVAPLVPDFDIAQPKPKARRKRKGEVGNPSIDLMDALKASVEAMKSVKDSPAANRSEDRQGGLSFPTLAESPSHLPARCNRGACTGTIKPNGRCIRCNQEPLKESK